MKNLFLLLCSFLLFSCFENEQEKKKVAAKNPYVNQNSVTILISNSLWEGKVGEKIREKFTAPIKGLHECESKFVLMPVHGNLTSDAKTSRNILKISKNSESSTLFEKDKYIKNQNVFTVVGENEDEILKQLQFSCKKIMKTFYESEIQLLLQKTSTNKKLQQQVKKQFLVDIQIPKEYSKGLQGDNFLWLRKEIGSGYNNLLIYTASFSAIYNKKAVVTNSLFIRNQVSKKYVLGKSKDSYMVAEPAYYPNFETTKIHNNLAYEMRGSWEFHNDFMTGPYINIAIKDNKRKRFIIIDGFAFNPVHSKKELLFEMEAIIKSTIIL